MIYARFSCSKQREASIDDQVRVCGEWCEREGYEVVATYADFAMSGRTDERPEFRRMIASAGESDVVVVYMMDRFSRDPYDAPVYKRELASRGVRLVSAMEAIPDSPEGIIYEKLLEGLAACESLKTSVRVRRGMEGNALACKTNGVRVYGYREGPDGRYEVLEPEAAFVREAFARRLSGEAVNHIASDFAARGVRAHTGRPCGYTMVYKMLRNEKYRGVYSWGGTRREGGMPRLVDDVTFWRCQGVKGKKRRADEEWGDFALAGRVVCAGCGHNMPGVSGRGSTGRKYEYYDCRHCGTKAVRRDWLEGEIARKLRGLLEDREEAVRVSRLIVEAGDGDGASAEREQAQRSLSAAERGLKNILAAIEQGIVPPGTRERVAQLEEQRDRAKRDLASYGAGRIDVEDFADFLQHGATLTDRDLVEIFTYQALVSDEDVVVTLNYDTKEREPARIEFGRVLTTCKWCALGDSNA
nr:recombinase family protein [uncultured Olsenella sp.]